MKLITKPNIWTCLPASLAMLMDVELDDIIRFLGHNGSERIWKHLAPPRCYRAFHIQEMVAYALYHKRTLTPIERQPIFSEPSDAPAFAFDAMGVAINQKAAHSYLKELYEEVQSHLHPIHVTPDIPMYLPDHDGLLLGLSQSGMPHAVAWNHDEGLIYCPNGKKLQLHEFTISTFWIINPK